MLYQNALSENVGELLIKAAYGWMRSALPSLDSLRRGIVGGGLHRINSDLGSAASTFDGSSELVGMVA